LTLTKDAYKTLNVKITLYGASNIANSDPLKTELATAKALYNNQTTDDDAVNEITALDNAYKTTANAQTYKAGDDVTSKITNPKFNNEAESSMTTSGWTVTGTVGAAQNAKLVESWHANFNVSQKLTGLKDGVYALSIQGFQRPGDDSKSIYTSSYLNGYSATKAYVFAGDKQVAVSNICDAVTSDNTQNGSWSDLSNGYYTPNDMNSSYTLMSASADNYKNVVLYKVTDNQMTIGFKSDDNQKDGWSIFHDFTMTYLGDDATQVATYLNNLVSQAKDLSTLYASIDAKTSLTTAISDAETAAAETDVDAMLTKYYALVSAMETIRATSTEAAYATFKGTLYEGKDNTGATVGLATFSSPRYAVTFTDGDDATTKAYIATAVSDTKITFKRVLAAPANTGLLLMGTKDGKFEMNGVASADALTGTNLLQPGQDKFGKLQTLTTSGNYGLADGGNFGAFSEEGKMQPNKAYLHIESTSAKSLTLEFEDTTTGVKTVKTVTVDAGKFYNLNGVEIAKPTQQGVYIHNGKKYIVR
jgi:hypothetical protein